MKKVIQIIIIINRVGEAQGTLEDVKLIPSFNR